jgi:hypothetical protein
VRAFTGEEPIDQLHADHDEQHAEEQQRPAADPALELTQIREPDPDERAPAPSEPDQAEDLHGRVE